MPRRACRLGGAVGVAVLLSTALVCTTVASADPQTPSAGPAPFQYEYKVVDFSATATLTYAKTAATIRYRLLQPSESRIVRYFGAHPKHPGGAWKVAAAKSVLDVAAQAAYTSPDPSCRATIEYRPAGNKIVEAYVYLDPRGRALRRIAVDVSKLPLATPDPGQDAGEAGGSGPLPKCGRPVMGHWYQSMAATAPGSLVAGKRVRLSGHDEQTFTDPGIESIEWDLKVTLQRVRYWPVDCARHPAC